MARLSDIQQRAVELRLGGKTLGQIGKAMGRDSHAVANILASARKKLLSAGVNPDDPELALLFRHPQRVDNRPRGPHELTPAEQRVADLMDAGVTIEDVAARLGIKVSTVKAAWVVVRRKRRESSEITEPSP